ncbi:MAG: hypothetical protein IKI71_04775 [Lachnospiraceae bacterium]|nr:hypothetical protein [Lachnospiraceae bacterium]
MSKPIKILIFILIVVLIQHIIFKVKIKNIDIVGNNVVTDSQIVTSIFESERDSSSVVFFIKSKFKKKKAIPLINSYEIEWVTPFSIIIRVDENKAIAFMKRDLKNVYFDKEGVIVDVSDERKAELIEVIGVSFNNYERGDKIDIPNKKILKAILNISSFLSEHNLKAELIEIRQNESIQVYMGDIVANMGDTDNMEIKLLRLNDIYPKISHLKGTLDLSKARENMLDEQYIFKKAS